MRETFRFKYLPIYKMCNFKRTKIYIILMVIMTELKHLDIQEWMLNVAEAYHNSQNSIWNFQIHWEESTYAREW